MHLKAWRKAHTCFNTLPVHVQPHCVRRVNPFCEGIEEENQLQFLHQWLLLAFELPGLAVSAKRHGFDIAGSLLCGLMFSILFGVFA